MSLWVPWEIMKIEGGVAHLKKGEYKATAKIIESGYQVGDCVNVQGGIIVGKTEKGIDKNKPLWKRYL